MEGERLGKSDLDFVGHRKRINSNDMNDLMNLPKKVIPFKDYSKKSKSVKKGTKSIESRR